MKASQLQETALRYFLEVVRCGSLSDASQALFVATSAISRQISYLERSLEVPLFERHARGMVPTAAGEILASYAHRMSLEAERALSDIQALQGLHTGMVVIAATEGFAAYLLPELIVVFRQQYPGIQFQLDVVSAADVSTRIRHGKADIGLTYSCGPQRELQVHFHHTAPMMALMRHDHPLARRKSVTLQQISQYPLALPTAETTAYQLLDIVCSKLQLSLNPVMRTNSMVALQSFVLYGGGVSVFNALSILQFVLNGQVCAVPLRHYGLNLRDIEVQTLAGRGLPQAVRGFLDFLLERLPSMMGRQSVEELPLQTGVQDVPSAPFPRDSRAIVAGDNP